MKYLLILLLCGCGIKENLEKVAKYHSEIKEDCKTLGGEKFCKLTSTRNGKATCVASPGKTYSFSIDCAFYEGLEQ